MSAKIIIVETDARRPQPGQGGELAYSWSLVYGDNQHITGAEEHREARAAAEQAIATLEQLKVIAADQRRKEQAARHA